MTVKSSASFSRLVGGEPAAYSQGCADGVLSVRGETAKLRRV